MNKVYKIYTLTCPITNQIVYVGKTSKPLEKRLYAHMSCCNGTGSFEKHLYTRKLKHKKLQFIIDEIETTNSNIDAIMLEKYWISQFKAWGFKLFNLYGIESVTKVPGILFTEKIKLSNKQVNEISKSIGINPVEIKQSMNYGSTLLYVDSKIKFFLNNNPNFIKK